MSRPRLEEQRRRLTVTVDKNTMRTLDRIKRTVAEVDGPSSAIRFMARWYDQLNDGKTAGK